ncbi:MAG: HNH endonuclease [Arcicella sp.]|nr:HNH endonuclease [Arcicella sp.]
MYKIYRTPESKPKILEDNAKAWTEDYLLKRGQNPNYKHHWHSSHNEIFEALSILTAEHCSYCDKYPLDERAKSDVQIDHFKPISKLEFRILAYEWMNLYLACGGCNKSKLAQYSDLIIRPDDEDYDPLDYFFFDIETAEILVNKASGNYYIQKAEKTIEVFKLNHKSIIKFRKRAIENFLKAQKIGFDNFNIDDYDYRNFIAELL